jgi:phage baseplate assembly protein W
MTQYSFPFNIDGKGQTATCADDKHIRQLIEQVLFTTPGERVNRPTFGCGINPLLFAPNSMEIVAGAQLIVQGALQQWLGGLIQVEEVSVTNEGSTLQVLVRYIVRRSQQRQLAEFTKEV